MSTPHRGTRLSSTVSPGQHFPVSTTPFAHLVTDLQELGDSLSELETNMVGLQRVHESLSGFNESFGAFLYGLQVNAYAVEFKEVPQMGAVKGLAELHDKIAQLEELLGSSK